MQVYNFEKFNLNRSRLLLLLNTIKYLKFKQIYYRGFYLLRNKLVKKTYLERKDLIPQQLQWENSFDNPVSYDLDGTFTFLNLVHKFNKIDWNYNAFGKLWTYNLNYFDFLLQNGMTRETGLTLMQDFIQNSNELKDGLEPYPISLRTINWIKFITIHKIKDEEIDQFLFQDFQRLLDQLEYHILGNHLLENGFSLLFGAYYFKDEKLFSKAEKIISSELNEQILKDGSHYERSPMYHKILLGKTLDCLHLMFDNKQFKNLKLLSLLKEKSEIMIGFLEQISFANGDIPLVNDAAFEIAPTNANLLRYAKQLGLEPKKSELSDSGYRKWQHNGFEVVLDVGSIGPDYQPGHAHADTFNFILYYQGKPIIVDTGTSTYNIGNRRDYERSTLAHNTVVYQKEDSSQVWGGFRVANRAKVRILEEDKNTILASHNGYKKQGVIHEREFTLENNAFKIEDCLQGNPREGNISSIHFHPKVTIDKNEIGYTINKNLQLKLSNFDYVNQKEYDYAPKFNELQKAIKIEGVFHNKSSFTIEKV